MIGILPCATKEGCPRVEACRKSPKRLCRDEIKDFFAALKKDAKKAEKERAKGWKDSGGEVT